MRGNTGSLPERKSQDRCAPGLGIVQIGNSLLAALLLLAAALRETPEFWLHSGGYPVWLRELIRWLFYPGLGVFLLVTAGEAWIGCRMFSSAKRSGNPSLVLFTLHLLVLIAVLLVMLWNNLSNLWQGAPLHQHVNPAGLDLRAEV